MKFYFVALLTLFASAALAGTGVLFTGNASIIVVQGQDQDAPQLFEAMKVPAQEMDNIQKKKMSFSNMYGDPVFELNCSRAVLSPVASCSLKIHNAGAVVDRTRRSVLLGINEGFEAAEVAELFHDLTSSPHQAQVFTSGNGKLRIWKTFSSDGNIASFTILYQE